MKTIYALTMAFLMGFLAPSAIAADINHTKRAIYEWIDQETRVSPPKETVQRIVNSVYAQAKKHGIDPFLILSTIRTESRFKVQAKSPYGAKGLMQIVTKFHRDKIAGRNIFNIETNIEVGTQILVDCLDKNDQVLKKALRCYSGGARDYEAKLREGHKSLRKTDVIYRFANELPLATHARFDKPMLEQSPDVQTIAMR